MRDKRKRSFASCAAAVFFLLAVFAGASYAASEITINGSTTILPFAHSTAEAFMKLNPKVRISVSGGGSGNGAKALIDGMIRIAAMSREMKKDEIAKAKERGVNPVKHVVAVDCIVPIVHRTNPVNNLTAGQLRAIYAGEITNWREVGGEDKKIAVLGRDTSSGTFEVWEEKIMKGAYVTPRALIVASSGAMVQSVASNPMAIGYDSLGYVNPALLKPLSVNGVKGTAETARTEKIITSRPLFMYTNGEPKGDVKKYLDFLLSADGQKYVTQEGFVSLR